MKTQVSSTAIAHVADAIEFITGARVTGDSDYDTVASQAAALLKSNAPLLRMTDAYGAGHRSWDEFVAEVRACMQPEGN